jgi:hypothetical protein
MTNEQRIAGATAAAARHLQQKSGSTKLPILMGRLAALLALLHRKGRPLPTRETITKWVGYKSVHSLDKATQKLLECGYFTLNVRTLPGNSASGPSIRKERFLVPDPMLFSMICANVIWK